MKTKQFVEDLNKGNKEKIWVEGGNNKYPKLNW